MPEFGVHDFLAQELAGQAKKKAAPNSEHHALVSFLAAISRYPLLLIVNINCLRHGRASCKTKNAHQRVAT